MASGPEPERLGLPDSCQELVAGPGGAARARAATCTAAGQGTAAGPGRRAAAGACARDHGGRRRQALGRAIRTAVEAQVRSRLFVTLATAGSAADSAENAGSEQFSKQRIGFHFHDLTREEP
jgi:hypothetical protein